MRSLLISAFILALIPVKGHAFPVPSGCAYAGKPVAGSSSEPEYFESLVSPKSGIWNTFVARNWPALSGTDIDGARVDQVAAMQRSNPCVRIIISYPGVPKDGPTREQCQAGSYDSYYRSYANKLKARNIRNVVMRIGWEWDIDTNKGMSVERDIAKAPAFAGCFRRIVSVMRAAYPQGGFLFDYNSSGMVTKSLLERGYPGNDVVDVISVEAYDNRPCKKAGYSKNDPACRWANVEAVNDMVRDFAKSKGKYTAFPEWGIWNDGGATGVENPYHVRKLCEYAKNPANKVMYYAYFQTFNHEVVDLRKNPGARAAYNQYCGVK